VNRSRHQSPITRGGRFLTLVMGLALVMGLLVPDARVIAGPALILGLAAAAIGVRDHPLLRSFGFTIWVFAFVAASMFYPGAFGSWFGFDLRFLIVPLIQIITFGMGTTLSLADFRRVLTSPWPVFIGLVLQFSVMPVVGFLIATGFRFEPEVAAGVILIGSVSGGVASNLMVYLARGNVALSVTMTACSTR
jgi:BASS family bile acid:Na+ symporter